MPCGATKPIKIARIKNPHLSRRRLASWPSKRTTQKCSALHSLCCIASRTNMIRTLNWCSGWDVAHVLHICNNNLEDPDGQRKAFVAELHARLSAVKVTEEAQPSHTACQPVPGHAATATATTASCGTSTPTTNKRAQHHGCGAQGSGGGDACVGCGKTAAEAGLARLLKCSACRIGVLQCTVTKMNDYCNLQEMSGDVTRFFSPPEVILVCEPKLDAYKFRWISRLAMKFAKYFPCSERMCKVCTVKETRRVVGLATPGYDCNCYLQKNVT